MTEDQSLTLQRIADMLSEITAGIAIAVGLTESLPDVCDMLGGMRRIADLAAGELDVVQGIAHR